MNEILVVVLCLCVIFRYFCYASSHLDKDELNKDSFFIRITYTILPYFALLVLVMILTM